MELVDSGFYSGVDTGYIVEVCTEFKATNLPGFFVSPKGSFT